jgi:hypothetical protein
VSTQWDPSNCGSCANTCTSYSNSSPVCATGACGYVCTSGFLDCNGSFIDGCEIAGKTDNANCGACGNKCAAGTACDNGACIASGVIYSQTFPTGAVSTSDPVCTTWKTFVNTLQPTATYAAITIKGTNDATGVTCSGATANTLCQALRTATTTASLACGGRNWMVSTGCGAAVELSANGDACQCGGTTSYRVRPCQGGANWGGVNGATCSAASQAMTVICQ